MYVAEEEIRGFFRYLGQLGLPGLEDIEVRFERIADVEILVVVAFPAKRFAVGSFESLKVDVFGFEQIDVFLREVGAYDSDEIDVSII